MIKSLNRWPLALGLALAATFSAKANGNPPQDKQGPRCHAKPCASGNKGPGERHTPREREDRARRDRIKDGLHMTHTKPGIYVRTAVFDSGGQEIDCREFPIETCDNRDEHGRDAYFSYDYVRTAIGEEVLWSVHNEDNVREPNGDLWVKRGAHGYRARPASSAERQWSFIGKEADEYKPPCAVRRFNGWQQMMEDRIVGGIRPGKITVSLLERLLQTPPAADEREQ